VKALIRHLLIILSIGQVFGQKTDSVKVIEYSQSACDRTSDPDRLKPRIISLEHHADTLNIEIGFATTCCLEYIPNVKYSADTLYISYKVKDEGEACMCICCYSFNHKIKGINTPKLTVKLYDQVIELSNEKYWTYEPTFTILNGDTVNRKDKYGLKQWIWITTSDNFIKYKDDRIDKRGKIHREFYGNGKIKKQCYKTSDGEILYCRQWTRSGRELK